MRYASRGISIEDAGRGRAPNGIVLPGSSMPRFATEKIDQRPELERNVAATRIEQDKVRALRGPVGQDGDQFAVGDEWRHQGIRHLRDPDAVEAGAQSEVEVIHVQRPFDADLDLPVGVLEFPGMRRVVTART